MKKHSAWASQMLQLAALVLLYTLDVRDLVCKLVWLGPPDNFAFDARSSSAIDAEPLALALNVSSSLVAGDAYPKGIAAAPWYSFYANCEQLHAGDKVFDTFVGTNCRLGTFGSLFTAPALVFSASVRVDSVAWASCKMLFLHRRPPLCQEPIVANFSRRYHLQDLDVRLDEVVSINSDAEFELLRMLDMLSRAQPLSKVVCTEGFQYGGPGQYSPSLFTCASPNYFESFPGDIVRPRRAAPRVLAWRVRRSPAGLQLDTALSIALPQQACRARAYRIARFTYISLPEVLAIVGSVCFFERAVVFDIAMQKHRLEAQRTWSPGVFAEQIAFSNSYNAAQEATVDVPPQSLRAVYDPLVSIVFESLFLVGVVLVAKFAYFSIQQRKKLEADEACRVAAEIEVIESTDDLDLSPRPLLRGSSTHEYARLPLEDRVQLPIRASSIVRSSFALERVIAEQQYIDPPVYFAAGLVVKDGFIRTRRGFLDIIHPKLDSSNAATVVPAADSLEDSSSGSPSKSSIASAKATAVANLVLATDVPGAGVGGLGSPNSAAADASGGAPGRRPLAETASAAAARSMRRRKSINEFTSIQL
ncbi:hypothetical protein PybrP1_002756 [[Pythium] brassicae (nom. inval.)]|nr:hypothetical protein PybrP1_002756 [[Pythium] brassicae (nom. inval.)]